MNAKVLVVFVLALLGVAAFLFLRPGTEHGPAPIGAQSADQRGSPTSPAEPAHAGVMPATVATDAPSSAERTEAASLGAGKGSAPVAVRGRIVDGVGAPRAGVELALRTWAGLEGIDLADVPPPPMRGRDANKNKQQTWTTRSDGTFEIPVAKDALGALDLVTPELVFAGNEPSVTGKKGDQDLGDVAVLAAARVSGVVHDQRGQPVAGVKVAATIGALGFGNESSQTTKDDGTFSLGMLRPGKWSLRTASGKFLPTVEEIELAAEEQRTGVVLVVKPGKAIAGQVVDDRGIGVAKMKVGSQRREAHGGMDIERFSSDESTTTDDNGYFTLSGLAEETASVRAFGPGHTSASASDVQVGTGNLVLRVERLGIVEGVLVGTDGAPIAGSRVSSQGGAAANPLLDGITVDDLDLDGPPGAGRGAVTAADGSFRLESVRPGSAAVVARGKTHRPVRQSGIDVLPAQATKGVRLVADRGAVARIKVSDEAGKPVAGAKVRAQRAGEQGPQDGRFFSRAVRAEDNGDGPVLIGGDALGAATTGEDGVATIAGLPGGDLSFAATHDEFAPSAPARLAVPKTGTVDGAVTLRKPGSAEIVAFGSDGSPLAGVEIEVKAESGNGAPTRVTSGDGGAVRVAALAPGNYTAALARAAAVARFGDAMAFATDGGGTIASSAQRFTVVAGETVRVEVRRPVLAKVHGVVTGGDGPAPGCVVALVRNDGDGIGLPGFGGRNATTGNDGSFAFDDVEAGSYTLEYGKRDQVVKARRDLDVPPNTADVQQDLALHTGKLRVQVVASGTGEPVDKAEVEIARADSPAASGAPRPAPQRVMMVSFSVGNNNDAGGGDNADMTTMTMGMQRTLTDEAGVAVLDDVPVGEYTLRIKHRKHAPRELRGVTVVENQLTDCGRIELAAAGLIRGKTVGADGKSVRMALVSSRPLDSQQWSEPVVAQGGNYRVQGLAAGRYKVRAQAMGPGEQYGPEVEVEVKAGETANADLQVPASGQ
jgi:protocatechuate 3,4-dioxygenase beta subunit